MRKREIEKAKSALKYGSKCIENEDWSTTVSFIH